MADVIAREIGGGDVCCHLTDVTSTLVGLGLVGPRCRDVLRKLTSADLRDRVLSNDACAQLGFAKVPALLARRDRSGLPSYWLCVSRDYGEYVWDVLFEAGRELDIAPIGLSAWRALAEEA